MLDKDNIAITLALLRRNATPIFCVLVPQVSGENAIYRDYKYQNLLGGKGGWRRLDRPGWVPSHSTSICRRHPVSSNRKWIQGYSVISVFHAVCDYWDFLTAPEEIKDLARAWVEKLAIKNGTYPPDSYPNPGIFFLQRLTPFHDKSNDKLYKHWLIITLSCKQVRFGRNLTQIRSKIWLNPSMGWSTRLV